MYLPMQELDLSHNKIVDIPASFYYVYHGLTTFGETQHRLIPGLRLSASQELDLSHNKIVDIPAELLSLTGLTNLLADGLTPPIHLLS